MTLSDERETAARQALHEENRRLKNENHTLSQQYEALLKQADVISRRNDALFQQNQILTRALPSGRSVVNPSTDLLVETKPFDGYKTKIDPWRAFGDDSVMELGLLFLLLAPCVLLENAKDFAYSLRRRTTQLPPQKHHTDTPPTLSETPTQYWPDFQYNLLLPFITRKLVHQNADRYALTDYGEKQYEVLKTIYNFDPAVTEVS